MTESSKSPKNPPPAAFSKRHTFPYATIVRNQPVKPAIPLALHSLDGKQRFPLYALPDSGADWSCFPEEWAGPLGIELAACEKKRVKTGAGLAHHFDWRGPLIATVAEREIKVSATFGPVDVGILGRDDFFKCFRVEFDHRTRVTHLMPYDA